MSSVSLRCCLFLGKQTSIHFSINPCSALSLQQAIRLLEHAEAQKQAQKAPAAQPQQDKAPPPKPQPSPEDPQMASAVSDCLRSLGEVLGVPASTHSPAPAGGGARSGGGGAAATASAVAKKVAELVAQLPADFFKPLVAPGSLDAAQVEDLNEVAQALQAEYTVRRRMLLERLKVTLQVGLARHGEFMI
ncbi:hypothetical protein DUNSADRAFT_14434 [Dunaliella salina]|uniref:Uncharacterized protein n=1 Tax=Dunaliella salina TaxID=3046 RepID=A0ABQ7H9I7_DUNSA|nr:hypothetical protein DUNSADRAFT_14434 [Dunaliella salina]|eukprot:KAF5843518.1 hypothetical protein DUNSADRAFT_14434 [Dunaliella salina]